jgi:hypothetical protein
METTKFKCDGSSILSTTCNKNRKEILVDRRFDEQLQFINSQGEYLRKVHYTLNLEDGTTFAGTTDSVGRTERIRTSVPLAITKIKLQPVTSKIPTRAAADVAQQAHSCSIHSSALPDFLILEIDGIKTNAAQLGTSVAQVNTPEESARGLTAGEIGMARIVFKDSIDYARVKIHNGEFLWLGAQKDDTALAPNGEIYFNTKSFKEDFSESDGGDRLWFMHEMTHVWQFQLGYPVLSRVLRNYGLDLPRKYDLDEDELLCDYNIEAQGNIIADYWAILDAKSRGTRVKYMHRAKYMDQVDLFEKVLREFIKNPADKSNLPTFLH